MNAYHVIRLVVATAALYASTAAVASAQCPPLNCSDTASDVNAIQCLLNQGGTIVLPADGCQNGYIIDGTLHLNVSGTTFTSSSAFGNRALLLAAAGLSTPMMVVDPGVLNYTISNIFFYGNRFNRTAPNCTLGSHQSVNLWLKGSGWTVDNIESDTVPCQTSTVVDSSNSSFVIRNSVFANNGWSEKEIGSCGGMASKDCADGLTVHACVSGFIHDNQFIDNTDIDLVVGGGSNCTIQTNTVQHNLSYGQAGFQVGFFQGGNGNHSASTYGPTNTVSSGLDKLAFGIMVGNHPFDVNLTLTDAGSVLNNTASGAVINLAVEGIAPGGGGVVSGNTLSGAQGSDGFGACTVSSNYTVYHPHAGAASLQPDPLPLELQFDSNVGCIGQ